MQDSDIAICITAGRHRMPRESLITGGKTMNVTSPVLQNRDELLNPGPLPNAWTHDEVRGEVSRILRSRLFIKSTRLSCFLSTAIDYLLAGKANSFKEYTVGTEVYGRPATYDPTHDTIVRTEARRLRSKLKEYYASLAVPRRLRITLVSGSYVPVIELGYISRGDDFGIDRSVMHPGDDDSLSLAVISFNAKAVEPGNQDIASNLEEELTHELSQNPDIKVFRTCGDVRSAREDQFSHWNRSGIQFALRGYVRQTEDGPVAQLQLTTIQGMILWSERFVGACLLSRSNEIASAVCTAFFRFVTPRAQSGFYSPGLGN